MIHCLEEMSKEMVMASAMIHILSKYIPDAWIHIFSKYIPDALVME
jgi:hypothetical protein